MKSLIRKEALNRRLAIPEDKRLEKNKIIESKLLALPELTTSRYIALYVDYRGEVATRKLFESLKQLGKIVAFPIAHFDTGQLTFVAIDSLDLLQLSDKKIWEPPLNAGQIISNNQFDIIFVPGAAFSRNGYRIGYGGGFYDRLLAQKQPSCQAIGLAFTEQLVDTLPLEAHDHPLNTIITDTSILRF